MWMILQQEEAEDFVISTGETHSVREFVELAFDEVGLNYKDYVVTDKVFMRPSEVDLLVGDASKAKKKLGWVPSVTFRELVKIMVNEDLKTWQRVLKGEVLAWDAHQHEDPEKPLSLSYSYDT